MPYVFFFYHFFWLQNVSTALYEGNGCAETKCSLAVGLGRRFWGSRLEHLRIQRDDSATATVTVDAMYN